MIPTTLDMFVYHFYILNINKIFNILHYVPKD